jgi:hypothetical protein
MKKIDGFSAVGIRNDSITYGSLPPEYGCPFCEGINTHVECLNGVVLNKDKEPLIQFWAECGHQWLLHIWTSKGMTYFDHVPLNTVKDLRFALSAHFEIYDHSSNFPWKLEE